MQFFVAYFLCLISKAAADISHRIRINHNFANTNKVLLIFVADKMKIVKINNLPPTNSGN